MERNKMDNKKHTKKILLVSGIAIVVLSVCWFLMNRFLILPTYVFDENFVVGDIDSPDGNASLGVHYYTKHVDEFPTETSEVLYQHTQIYYGKIEYIPNEEGETKSYEQCNYIYYDKGIIPYDQIRWLDDETVQIGDIKLNPRKSVYDYRIHFWRRWG